MPLGSPSGPQVLSRTPETMEWLGASVAKNLTVKENTLKPVVRVELRGHSDVFRDLGLRTFKELFSIFPNKQM